MRTGRAIGGAGPHWDIVVAHMAVGAARVTDHLVDALPSRGPFGCCHTALLEHIHVHMRVGAFGIGGKGRDGESRRQAEAAKRVFSCAVPPSDKIDVFVERHLADALTGGRKDRIGQCGRGGGQAGFTNTMDLVAIG